MTLSSSRLLTGAVKTVLVLGTFCFLIVWVASAQNQNGRMPPHVGYAYPAGGQIGTTFTVLVGGQNLEGATGVYVSGRGITGKITGFDRPLNQRETNQLREELDRLQQKRQAALGLPAPTKENGKKSPAAVSSQAADTSLEKATWTPDDTKRLAEIRQLMQKRANRFPNPAIAETASVEISIDSLAATGFRELRLHTPLGLSNPIRFQVGELPEVTAPGVCATTNPALRERAEGAPAPSPSVSAATAITVPSVLNGQILAGEVDRFTFEAVKGQRLALAVSARSLTPYLADAVPGWFQATIGLFDARGREVAYADSFRSNPDPLVCFDAPETGRYTLEIKDSIFRGREDFVYRVAIGDFPVVTSVFPLGAQAGAPATFTLSGWNLSERASTLALSPQPTGTYRVRAAIGPTLGMSLDPGPARAEEEPNNTPREAQTISTEVNIDGRIGSPGDIDVFRFEAKAGAKLVVACRARIFGSPLDATLRLTDSAGTQLAFNDDCDDQADALTTHHADPRLSVALPKDDTYFIAIGDAQGAGGAAFGYRLTVAPPQPDFALRAVPSAINVPAGGSTTIVVHALRQDGFDGEIALGLVSAPSGISLGPAVIPAGQSKVEVKVFAAPATKEALASLTLAGAARINGRAVSHVAGPAEDMMQAFAYHHLVPTSEMLVNIIRGGRRPANQAAKSK